MQLIGEYTVSMGRQRMRQLASLTCYPSWMLLAGLVYFRVWVDGECWPYCYLFNIAAGICALSNLYSMTLSLLAIDNQHFTWRDVGRLFWTALPLMLMIGWALLTWFSALSGGEPDP